MLALDPAAPALEFEHRWYPWGDLGAAADAIEPHVAPGERVAVLLRNRPPQVGLLLGLLRAGACVVTANPERGAERVRADLESLGVGTIAGEATDLEALAPPARWFLSDRLGAVDITGDTPEEPDALRPGVAVEMLTSGTTGPPKRVPLTYETLLRVLVGAKHYERNARADLRLRSGVTIVNSPLVHLGGLFRILQCVNDGRAFCLLERFRVDEWADAVRRHHPRTVSLVPAALRMVLEADLDPADLASVRSVVSGTAPLSPDDADAFREKYGVPVLISYAATEFGGGVAGWNLADHEQFWTAKRGSVGPRPPGLRAARRRSRHRRAARPRRRGPARGQDPATRRRRANGRARPTTHESTPTASCGSSGAPTRRSSGAGSRSGPKTCAPRSNATRACAAPPSSAVPTRASARCRSRRSSCARVCQPVTADELLAERGQGARALRAARRAEAGRRAAPHAFGQGRPRRRARAVRRRVANRRPSRGRSASSRCPRRVAVAPLLRRVAGLVQALEHDDPAVGRLTEDLRAAERALASRVPADPRPRIGADAPADGRPYVDHARDIGAYNPCFPEYEITVDGPHASGTVTFPLVFEGPPGVVHGGVLATFFDCVVQHHNCDVGVAGKTTSLLLEYRRPTPLGVPLRSRSTARPTDAASRRARALFHGRRDAVHRHDGSGRRRPVPLAARLAATERTT